MTYEDENVIHEPYTLTHEYSEEDCGGLVDNQSKSKGEIVLSNNET